MTRISMKALLGAGAVAAVAAISLTPAAQAQGQPGTMNAPGPGVRMGPDGQPGAMGANGQPGTMNPAAQPNGYPYSGQPAAYPYPAPQNGYGPQQNAYVPPSGPSAGPGASGGIPQEANPRYPGPKLN